MMITSNEEIMLQTNKKLTTLIIQVDAPLASRNCIKLVRRIKIKSKTISRLKSKYKIAQNHPGNYVKFP